MSFEVKDFNCPSTDGIHTLRGKIYIPNGEIKALFHIVHGMTEHVGRYDRLMSHLAENGVLAFGYDNLGHGKTANSDSELGFIAEKDGWKFLRDDVDAYGTAIKEQYPNIPLILMGHSMGSFIIRLAAEKYPENYSKVIICGTGYKNPLAAAGLLITSLIGKLKGKRHVSKTVQKMAFGSYNKKFVANTGYEWLTKDISVIAKYAADKYCTFKFSVSAMHDLIKLCDMANKNAWFKNFPKQLPVLLISGEDDPVGDYGKGITKINSKLTNNKVDVKCKLYGNCRHEILNDSCREEVLYDILNFVKE